MEGRFGSTSRGVGPDCKQGPHSPGEGNTPPFRGDPAAGSQRPPTEGPKCTQRGLSRETAVERREMGKEVVERREMREEGVERREMRDEGVERREMEKRVLKGGRWEERVLKGGR